MADEILTLLTRFHREIVVPDIERIVESKIDRQGARFDEVLSHLDRMYKRFDTVDSEILALTAAVRPVG
jgi:hypothetical protein